MKDLQELIKLLTARSQNPLPLLGKREMKPGKETTLYEKIKSGEYTNDEQAALDLYGTTPADTKYRVLKNRLEQKLLNQLYNMYLDLVYTMAAISIWAHSPQFTIKLSIN